MAKDKTSFVLYCDLLPTVSHLTDEQAGRLFKHILQYVNDQDPKSEDVILNLAFEPIKSQLKRDLKNWNKKRKVRSQAGREGGIKSGKSRQLQAKQNEAKRSKPKQTQANEAVNVNVNVNGTVNVNEILSEIEIGATIQFCSFSLSREYDKPKIENLWQAFLINGQEKSYTGREKKIKHFRNWIKTQPYINGTHQQPNRQGYKARTSKSDGANKLLDSLREDYERS